MALYNDVWREINAADCSTCREGNRTKVNDSSSFKAMPINRQERINKKIEDAELKSHLENGLGTPATRADIVFDINDV